MTIQEAITRLDGLNHNTYTDTEKRSWLTILDQRLRREVLDICEDAPGGPLPKYTPDTPGDTVLLAEPPYDDMYLWYMVSLMDFLNGEIERYNNSSKLFQNIWDEHQRFYLRSHRVKSQGWRFF